MASLTKNGATHSAVSQSVLISFMWALLALAAVGCDGDQPMLERASVSGSVTLDGKPLQAGAIVFHSTSQEANSAAVTSFGFVENGSYRIDADKGPPIGSARVEFRSKPLQRGEVEDAIDQAAQSRSRRPPRTTIVEIPAKYGNKSTLNVLLTDGDNRHDFQLSSKR